MTANTSHATAPAVRFSYLNDAGQPNLRNDDPRSTNQIKSDAAGGGDDEVFMNENEMNRVSIQTSTHETAPNSLAPVLHPHQHGGLSAVAAVVAAADAIENVHCVQVSVHQNPGVITSPTTTAASSTTRRPSYTSKAPSALTNLPKTIEEISSSPNSLPRLQELGQDLHSDKRLVSSDFQNGQRSTARELLSLHGQASFESLDEYSNPGTPQSNQLNDGEIATPGSAGLVAHAHRRDRPRLRTDALKGQQWEAAARAEVLTVRCRDHIGELHKLKFGSGSKGKCIKVNEKWYTPIEFESLSGRASCKDWKRSIRFHGQHLQKLIEDQFITLHAISCTCGICCGDDTLTGPVKLFQSVKRKRSQVTGNNMPAAVGIGGKRKSISEEYRAFRDRTGSYNVENDVFVMSQDDATMPPMTPVTPITPMTPHTPFGAACMTPLATSSAAIGFRSNSPPKSITLQVPASQVPILPRTMVPSTAAKIELPVPLSIQNPACAGTPPQQSVTPAHVMPTDFQTLSQQHWIQLEEMASSLVSMANKLKLMVEQTKIQCEAISNSAITQAKIQAENEKQEALLNLRRGQLVPQPINNSVVSMEPLPQTQQFTVQVPRVCANCGRDAYLECTGCFHMYYCGPYCQQKDWTTHKNKCRELATEPSTSNALTQSTMATPDKANS